MNKHFKYKGYTGSIEFSLEDECLFGKVLHIRDGVIYDGDTLPELEQRFKACVDAYIKDCERLNKKPNKPYSGSFNVRIGEELHYKLAKYSVNNNMSLNEAITRAAECLADESSYSKNIDFGAVSDANKVPLKPSDKHRKLNDSVVINNEEYKTSSDSYAHA